MSSVTKGDNAIRQPLSPMDGLGRAMTPAHEMASAATIANLPYRT